MDRLLLVSSDGHAAARPDDCRPYLEKRHLAAYEEWLPRMRRGDGSERERSLGQFAGSTVAEHFDAFPLGAGSPELRFVVTETGVDHPMWGSDYPHVEGTWPHTKTWLRNAFAGVSRVEVERMLGANAVECYGFDATRLSEVARRIGPAYEDLG